jgi:hypothetical protein
MMTRRLLIAFLVAPLFTPLVFTVTVFSRNARAASWKPVAVIFLLYTPFAYLAEALFGIPVLLIYRFLNWRSFFAYGSGGAMIGLIAMLVVSKLLIVWSVAPGDFVWCIVAGVISALAFRFLLGDQSDCERPVTINGEI